MEKFTRTMRGYDPSEVNRFLDNVIKQVDKMVKLIKEKDKEIKLRDKKIMELQMNISETNKLRDRLAHYERMESTLRQAIMMAQKTSDQIKSNAYRESEVIIDNAKKNASRIVNDALLRAEKIEIKADTLERNVKIFKKKLRLIVEQQLAVVEEIEELKID